jgi:PLP dependent protein
MAINSQRLRANLSAIEERIGNACARAGRARTEVTMVAVTKTVTAEVAALLSELGIFDLGENRPQELWRKADALPKKIRWHLIGHLQRNKIDKTLPLVQMIHAVDSVRLLHALEAEAIAQQRELAVLLEVNASSEASKQGFAPADLPGLAPTLRELKQVKVCGLMTMAALQEPEACRRTFRAVREVRDWLRPALPPPHAVEHLSMGMSNDFEVAIEEGATLIRLGSLLFEGIDT